MKFSAVANYWIFTFQPRFLLDRSRCKLARCGSNSAEAVANALMLKAELEPERKAQAPGALIKAFPELRFPYYERRESTGGGTRKIRYALDRRLIAALLQGKRTIPKSFL